MQQLRIGVVMVCLWAAGVSCAHAQETPTDYAWKPLLQHAGVDFAYIYYSREQTAGLQDGVVFKLVNTNDHPVRYRFKVVFRSGEAVHVEEARGELGPREIQVGDRDGLYWTPFPEGQPIAELGLRGYRVERAE